MPCCGRKNNPSKVIPIPAAPAPAPKAAPKQVVIAPRSPTPAPLGSFNPPGRFCAKCGWIIAGSKFADPTTGQILEKKSCTNRRCPDYR